MKSIEDKDAIKRLEKEIEALEDFEPSNEAKENIISDEPKVENNDTNEEETTSNLDESQTIINQQEQETQVGSDNVNDDSKDVNKVLCTVTNNSQYKIESLKLNALFFDKSGNYRCEYREKTNGRCARKSMEVEYLKPGETQEVSIHNVLDYFEGDLIENADFSIAPELTIDEITLGE